MSFFNESFEKPSSLFSIMVAIKIINKIPFIYNKICFKAESLFWIFLVINMSYHTNPFRKSTYDILSTSFQNTNYTTNILKPLYSNTDQPSPSKNNFIYMM